MKMRKFFIAMLLLITTSPLFANDEFTAKEFITQSKDTLRYRELLPKNYDETAKYPLVLFLHGSGERGSDNRSQMTHGANMFTNPVNREKYPAIVLFPQCPNGKFWSFDKIPVDWNFEDLLNTEIATPLRGVKELLDKYIATGNVDVKRIYIIGLSMGGMGTFDMICRYPDIFAAAIPICGGAYTEHLKETIGKVKIRIFHGDNDNLVPVENSRACYKALEKYGEAPEYKEFVGCGHDSWTPAFNQPDFFSWLFAQKKK